MGSVYEILSGAFFPGVGTATAQKLARHFGASLQSVLDKDSARALAGVVTEHKAELIVRGWRAYSAKRELEDWLREVGVDRSIADIAFKVWGLEAVQRIKANPYRLLAFLHWKAVDRVSLRAGVNASAQIRLTAGVEAAAYAFLEDDRSTWVAETELSARAAIMLGSDAETALVATALAESTGALIRLGFGYQVPGAYYAERYVEEWVSQRRLGIEPPEGWIQQFEVGLSAQQRIALRNAVRRSVSVFHGAAGTGITDTLRAICSTCVALGERPVLLAVTAKNARRLESTLGFTALNLEWALLNFDWDALSKPVVIVDEFVMVDLLSFRRLLRKIPGDARLVLCGDVNQLPSVGPGRLLHSFVFHGSAPVQT